MEIALLAAVAFAAGLACPAMMWWQRRKGETASCCPPVRRASSDLEELRSRRREVGARIGEQER